MAEEVVNLPEFHDRGDFEVNLHPLLEKTDIPRDSQGRTDFTYMSTDCFHLSQKGHARAANSYYNSMMTPEKQRARSWSKEFETFRCPTQQHPFLFTTKNSWEIWSLTIKSRDSRTQNIIKVKVSLNLTIFFSWPRCFWPSAIIRLSIKHNWDDRHTSCSLKVRWRDFETNQVSRVSKVKTSRLKAKLSCGEHVEHI